MKQSKHIWSNHPPQRAANERSAERRTVTVPARLTWKDHRGIARFASVVVRNVSEHGVYVECQSAVSIRQYRLVQVQVEREVRELEGLPASLRGGHVLSAVYRVLPPTAAGAPQGIALRLMVDPRRRAAPEAQAESRATA